eukprot:TRINITY_DN2060_c0_g2_i1.p1 TRINITY_DN2060_c0_g2~~TRINITY_DN2060_c0_g2_i1.p1  ORF type:complete len:133 (-),score=38.87 TRINITY_DN2060_c0_g2_i1:92-490(-)
MSDAKMNEALAKSGADWKLAAVLSASGEVYASKGFTPSEKEAKSFVAAFKSEDLTFANGVTVNGDLFEIHKIESVMMHGRRGDASRGEGEGVALLKQNVPSRGDVVIIATYELPHLAAKILPQLQTFLQSQE